MAKNVKITGTATININLDVEYGNRWNMETDAMIKLHDALQALGIEAMVLDMHVDTAYDENDVEIEVLDALGDETKDVDPRYTQM